MLGSIVQCSGIPVQATAGSSLDLYSTFLSLPPQPLLVLSYHRHDTTAHRTQMLHPHLPPLKNKNKTAHPSQHHSAPFVPSYCALIILHCRSGCTLLSIAGTVKVATEAVDKHSQAASASVAGSLAAAAAAAAAAGKAEGRPHRIHWLDAS